MIPHRPGKCKFFFPMSPRFSVFLPWTKPAGERTEAGKEFHLVKSMKRAMKTFSFFGTFFARNSCKKGLQYDTLCLQRLRKPCGLRSRVAGSRCLNLLSSARVDARAFYDVQRTKPPQIRCFSPALQLPRNIFYFLCLLGWICSPPGALARSPSSAPLAKHPAALPFQSGMHHRCQKRHCARLYQR